MRRLSELWETNSPNSTSAAGIFSACPLLHHATLLLPAWGAARLAVCRYDATASVDGLAGALLADNELAAGMWGACTGHLDTTNSKASIPQVGAHMLQS